MGTKIYGDILRHWQNHGRGLPTVLFAASVQQSEELVAEFRGAGVAASHIDASTPPAKRDEALKALASGSIEVLSNVGILTEGWDCPPAACGIMARPTASLCLHIQMVGRTLRTFPGKTGSIILDHAGNHLRHGFVTDDRDIDLEGLKKRGKKDGEEAVPSVRTCPKCYACMPSLTLVCPSCGHVFENTGREITYKRETNLQEIKPGPLKSWQRDMGREVRPDAPQAPRTKKDPATYYAEKLSIARERGYNVRWADHQFKATFGTWPTFTKEQVEEKQPERSWSW
jgi:superfamily II DNA or RNA helicase